MTLDPDRRIVRGALAAAVLRIAAGTTLGLVALALSAGPRSPGMPGSPGSCSTSPCSSARAPRSSAGTSRCARPTHVVVRARLGDDGRHGAALLLLLISLD